MSKNVVTLNLKTMVEGKEQVQKLTMDFGALNNAMQKVQRMNTQALNFAAVTTAISNAQQVIGSLNSAMSSLSAAYAQQEQAERQLQTVMMERMDATDEMVQKVKDLTAAQQKIGIIGDEVQLAGVQQVATFLKEAESIEILLPAMNNLLAQQKGYSATAADAVSVGTLFGKAMSGNTKILQRMGVSLDEGQKLIMEYGNEQERAAVLAEAITAKTGEMNASLAQTPTGQMKQLSNAMGDVKENLGKIANTALPFVTIAGEATIAAGGVIKLTKGVKVAVVAFRSMSIAIKGLMIASGVGIAIVALTTALEYFCGVADKAAQKAQDLKDKEAAAKKETAEFRKSLTDISAATASYAQQSVGKLERLMAVAKDETRGINDRRKAIADLKKEYPGYFDQISAEKIKVNELNTAYKNLKDNLLAIAQAKAIESKIEENAGKGVDAEIELPKAKKALEIWRKIHEIVNPSAGFTQTYNNEEELYLQVDRRLKAGNFKRGDGSAIRVSSPAEYYNLMSEAYKQVQIWTTSVKTLEDTISEVEAANSELADRLTEVSDKIKDGKPTVIPEPSAPKGTNDHAFRYGVVQLPKGALPKVAQPNFNKYLKTASKELVNPHAEKLGDILRNIELLQERLNDATAEEAANINKSIKAWEAKADAIRKAGEESKFTFDTFKQGWGAVRGVGSAIENVTSALKGDGNAWEKTTAVIDSSIQIIEAVMAVMQILNGLGLIGEATSKRNAAAKGEEAAASAAAAAAAGPEIAAKSADIGVTQGDAQANMTDAAAKTMNAHSWIPFVGIALGIVGIAAMIATIASVKVPKYAKGGLAYGPTLGMFGEYPGAANNPEVVAPLDKLRSMIQPAGFDAANVKFKIEGTDLVGVIGKVERKRARS